MTNVTLLIRLVFTSLIIFQTVSGQNSDTEPELLLFPTVNPVENEREQDPDLFYEWEGDPRWLTGVNWGGDIFFGGIGRGSDFLGSSLSDDDYVDVKIIFESTDTTWSQIYRRDMGYAAMGPGIFFGSAWDMSDEENPRRLNICVSEWDDGSGEHPPNMIWDPDETSLGRREYLFIMNSDYDGTGTSYDDDNYGPSGDVLYGAWLKLYNGHSFLEADHSGLDIKLAHIRNFQAISGDQVIDLSWVFDEEDLDFFRLYFGDDENNMEMIAELGPEERSFNQSGLINDEKYYFRLEGITNDGNNAYQSKTIHGIPHPVSVNINFDGGLNPYSNYGDIWGYTHPETGVEYALLCVRNEGLSIIDITNEPVEVGFVSSMSPAKDAKDVKVYDHYAVLIKEYEPAQIIDLMDPSNPVVVSTIHFGNNNSDGGAHNCYMDGSILYIIGQDTDGLEIYDLSDPGNPTFVSHYPTYYYHDIYVNNGLGYAAGIYGDGVDILDLTDLEHPQLLATFNYPASGAHNTWTTEDGNYVIVGDEIGGGPWTRIFDIQNLDNINMVSEYIVDNEAVVHNSYVKGNLLYVGHYTEGLRIVNISDPVNPQEVGYYDTYLPNEYGYKGCWSVYPFFESGKIIVSDMQSGLFVLTYDSGLSVEYSQGWNLVGLPIAGENMLYSELFFGVVEGTLYEFDGSYEQVSTLDPGNGYWLMFENGGTTVFSGDPIQELTLALSQDWNLISGIGFSIDVSSIEDPNSLIIPGTIYGFSDTYEGVVTLEPGKGYWLRSTGEGEITFSVSASTGKTSTFQAPDHLSTLTLKNTALYFGTDVSTDDILSYGLPPKPPAPATDIRFSGDTKLCTVDECLVQVMNDGQPIIVNYDIKDGEVWEIVDGSGHVTPCSGVQILELNGGMESFILRKSPSSVSPMSFSISPAYPNPFNPITRISFDLPFTNQVSLIIYDVLGQEVKELVKGEMTRGLHSVVWDAVNNEGHTVSAGIYFYNIHYGNYKNTKKLILLK